MYKKKVLLTVNRKDWSIQPCNLHFKLNQFLTIPLLKNIIL